MPRWSPDGTRLAVERRRLHGPSEIVVLNSDLSEAMPPISSRGRNTTPDWTADGGRILFASDRDGGPFALFSASTGGDTSPMKVLAPTGGALSPARTADGLVFVGYTVAGSDLFAEPNSSQAVIANPQPSNRQPAIRQPATHSPEPTIRNPQPTARNPQPRIRRGRRSRRAAGCRLSNSATTDGGWAALSPHTTCCSGTSRR